MPCPFPWTHYNGPCLARRIKMLEILGLFFLLDFIIGSCEQHMVWDASKGNNVYINTSTGMIRTSAGAPACSMGTPAFRIHYRREDLGGSY